jgi:GAF domain-containing protein
MVFLTSIQPMDPTEAFAELGKIKLSDTDLDGVLDTIADLAQRAIPGAAEVSVTLVRDKKAHTAAFTGELAVNLDEAQYESGHGPCLDASASATTLFVPETAHENRWPEWASQALDSGVHSSLSVGLPVQERVTGARRTRSAWTGGSWKRYPSGCGVRRCPCWAPVS